jgi:hypothetical protein
LNFWQNIYAIYQKHFSEALNGGVSKFFAAGTKRVLANWKIMIPKEVKPLLDLLKSSD